MRTTRHTVPQRARQPQRMVTASALNTPGILEEEARAYQAGLSATRYMAMYFPHEYEGIRHQTITLERLMAITLFFMRMANQHLFVMDLDGLLNHFPQAEHLIWGPAQPLIEVLDDIDDLGGLVEAMDALSYWLWFPQPVTFGISTDLSIEAIPENVLSVALWHATGKYPWGGNLNYRSLFNNDTWESIICALPTFHESVNVHDLTDCTWTYALELPFETTWTLGEIVNYVLKLGTNDFMNWHMSELMGEDGWEDIFESPEQVKNIAQEQRAALRIHLIYRALDAACIETPALLTTIINALIKCSKKFRPNTLCEILIPEATEDTQQLYRYLNNIPSMGCHRVMAMYLEEDWIVENLEEDLETEEEDWETEEEEEECLLQL